MAIDFSGVRYINNGEPVDESVLNRPVSDIALILENQVFDSLLDSVRINVASASNIDLTGETVAATRHINITGTTTITGFTVPAGKTYLVRFAGVLTLSNNSAIVTQTGANITTAAGDTCWIRSTANNVIEVTNYKHSILPVAQGGTGVKTSTGTGSVVLSASPTFTGNPTAPTQSAGDNSTRLATTAFVTTADNLKANIASPTFTGTVTGPTFNATTGGFQGISTDTVAAPSFTWTGDLNTGMYRVGTDSIGFTTGGVNRLTINSSGLTGVGSGLTALNASNLGSGTLPDARLSDSGLVTSTLVSYFANDGFLPLQYRKIGKYVSLVGRVLRSSPPSFGTRITTLPYGFRPSMLLVTSATAMTRQDGSNSQPMILSLNSAGELDIGGFIGAPTNGALSGSIHIDINITYQLA